MEYKFFLVLPHFNKADLKKSAGLISEYLSKLGYKTFVLCQNPLKVSDLKTEFLKLNPRNFLKHLKREKGSKKIVVFYFVPSLLRFPIFLFLKLYNPRIYLVIKTDGVIFYEKFEAYKKIVRGIKVKALYPLIDLIVTETPEYKDYLMKMYGKDLERKIELLPNGAELKNYKLKKRRRGYKSVLYAGFLSVPKGTHHLLQAFLNIKDKYPNWRLVLVGKPVLGFEAELRRYKKLLGEQLEVKGFLFGKELHQEFVDANVYVLPSFTHLEGFNFSLVEAMASKNAVIATDKAGAGYALDYGRAGFLFDKGDVNRLSELLSLLLGDGELRKKMVDLAYKRAGEHFDWNKIMNRFSSLLR